MLTGLKVSPLTSKYLLKRPEHNAKWESHTNEYSSKSRWEKRDICQVVALAPRAMVIKMFKMAHFHRLDLHRLRLFMSYLGSYLLVEFLLLCMLHHGHYGIEKVHILMLRDFSEKKFQSWKARDLLAGDLGRGNGLFHCRECSNWKWCYESIFN